MLREQYHKIQLQLQFPMLDADFKAEFLAKLDFCEKVFDCVSALKSIDADLELCKEHLEGDDEKLKATAERFIGEFLDCKTQIESQLNKVLWKEESSSDSNP